MVKAEADVGNCIAAGLEEVPTVAMEPADTLSDAA